MAMSSVEELSQKLESERRISQSHAHDLVRIADHLETFERGERGRREVVEEYKTMAYWLLVSKRDVKKLEIELKKAKGELVSPSEYEALEVAEKFVQRAERKL
jgi:hypothetical protein